MMKLLEQVAEWLTDEAKATLDRVNKNQLDAANLRIQAANKELSPAQRTIVETMLKLSQLKETFLALN